MFGILRVGVGLPQVRPVRADFSNIEEETTPPPSLAEGALGGAASGVLGCGTSRRNPEAQSVAAQPPAAAPSESPSEEAPAPVSGNASVSGQVQEDFSSGHTRYWYPFGEFRLVSTREALKVRGTAQAWSGFGVDTQNGDNGEPFDATGCRYLEFDISGTLSGGRMKVELTDFSGNMLEYWFDSIPAGNHIRGPLQDVSGKISKLQWVAAPNHH
jgi:hypothetical protein